MWTLTEEQRAIQRAVRAFARKELAPRARALDTAPPGTVDWDLVRTACGLGLMTGFLPKRYGGTMTGLAAALVMEELAAVEAGFATLVGSVGLGLAPVALSGDDRLMRRFFPEMIAAEQAGRPVLWALGLTEPEAGSDLLDSSGVRQARILTRAERRADRYRLSGRKVFCSGGNVASWVSVFAVMDPGRPSDTLTCFAVPTNAPGFSVGTVDNKLGLRACPTAELLLDDVEVPVENRVGQEGEGFALVQKVFAISRATAGAVALGIATGAFDLALRYTRERRQGGRYLLEHAVIRDKIAAMATAIESARLLVHKAALTRPPSMKLASMAKVRASEAAFEVSAEAVQLLGAYGCTKDFLAEKHLRDAKITQIFEGTNEICRRAIAEAVVSEATLTEEAPGA